MVEPKENQATGGAIARFVANCQGMTERDRRNARVTNLWLLGWMVVFVGTSFAIRDGYLEPGALAWGAVAASTALGLMVVRCYMRFIREADELLRKIQLEALAIGFGAAYVGNFALSLVERLRDQPFDMSDLFLLMVASYVVGIIAGMRRYA